MVRYFVLWILAITWISSCEQRSKPTSGIVSIDSKIADSTKFDNNLSIAPDLHKYIYTDTTYKSTTGKEITIQNSFPKGGSIEPDGTQYFDLSGKKYAFAAFWTRIINKSTSPIELNISFPADSFAIFDPPNSYLKLFLPTMTMTFDKLSSYNYGLTGIKSYLDSNLNKATMVKKTINPKEDYIFYVATLSYQTVGTPRAALIMKDMDLYYSMSIKPHGSGTIPCGKITTQDEGGN